MEFSPFKYFKSPPVTPTLNKKDQLLPAENAVITKNTNYYINELLDPQKIKSSYTSEHQTKDHQVYNINDLEFHGEGAYGSVYKNKNGDIVKISKKPVHLDVSTIIEISILKKLHHDNIIKLLYSGCLTSKNNGYLYYVMPLAPSNLKNAMAAGINVSQKMKYSIDLVNGVHYLQMNNIVHGDLKPENLLIIDNQIKIADFGLAMISTCTPINECVGSPAYMDPRNLYTCVKKSKENIILPPFLSQYLEKIKLSLQINKGYDKFIDNWSVGAILYEIWTQEDFISNDNVKQVSNNPNIYISCLYVLTLLFKRKMQILNTSAASSEIKNIIANLLTIENQYSMPNCLVLLGLSGETKLCNKIMLETDKPYLEKGNADEYFEAIEQQWPDAEIEEQLIMFDILYQNHVELNDENILFARYAAHIVYKYRVERDLITSITSIDFGKFLEAINFNIFIINSINYIKAYAFGNPNMHKMQTAAYKIKKADLNNIYSNKIIAAAVISVWMYKYQNDINNNLVQYFDLSQAELDLMDECIKLVEYIGQN